MVVEIKLNASSEPHDLPLLVPIGETVDLEGYAHDLPLLAPVGETVDLKKYVIGHS